MSPPDSAPPAVGGSRLRRRSFRTYLIAGFIISAGIPVLVVWTCLSRLFINRRHDEAELHVREAAMVCARRVDDFLEMQRRALAALALSPGMQSARSADEFRRAMAPAHRIYGGILGLLVADRTGAVVAAYQRNPPQSVANQEFFRRALIGADPAPFVSDAFVGGRRAAAATVSVSLPILDPGGKPAWVLEGSLDMTRFGWLRDSFTAFTNAQFLVLDGNRRVLYASDPVRFPALEQVPGAPAPPVGSAVTEWTLPVAGSDRGQTVLAGAAPANDLAGGRGWTVIVMTDYAGLRAEIAEYLAALLLGLAAMLGCVYAFSLLAARQVTLPVEGLAASVRGAVGQTLPSLPQPEHESPILEIAQLEDDLRAMCQRLSESYSSLQAHLKEREALSENLQKSKDELRVLNDELEKRVHERTTELRSLVVELEDQVMARAHTEELLVERNHLMEMIAADAALEDTLKAIIVSVEADIPRMMAAVHVFDEDAARLRIRAAPSLPESFRSAIGISEVGPSAGSCGAAAWTKETVVVDEIALSPLWSAQRESAAAHGIRACWSAPILNARRELLGTLSLFHHEPGRPDRRHLEIMEAATRTTAVAIDHARAEEVNRRLEAQLRHSQKLQAIGTLAGGIAHDFNNILTAIFGNADLLRLALPTDPQMHAYVTEILKASQRARDLVRQILTFSRKQEEERVPARLRPILDDVVSLLKATAPASVEVRVHLLRDEPTVLANSSQIHQVLMNLCTNAIQSMKSRGGTLIISETETRLDARDNVKPGRYVSLTVSDTGHGMDKRTVERIFDPFFTTKGPGEGTGLGLSVVHGIIHAHEGTISVASEPDRGTTFQVFLPIAVQADLPAPARPEPPPMQRPVPGRLERILLVDDEVAITSMGRKVLQRLGYQPVVFNDPAMALDWFAANPGSCDAVISDYSMPGMTGRELARVLLSIRPELPVIMITGYGANFDADAAIATGIREIVLKPFTIDTLASTLSRVLANRPVAVHPV